MSRKQSLFCLCRKRFESGFHPLCKAHEKTDAAGTFSFKNRCFQILDEGFPIINARREITVLINPRFGIRVEYGGRIYNTIRYLKPQNKNANTEVPQKVSKTVEPHASAASQQQ